jgi:hypothetical protein
MDRQVFRVAAGAAVLLLAVAVATQGQQQPPPTFEQAVVRQYNAVHKKIIDMAKDFPEDKFDSRPSKEVRSFVEEVWHVTQTAEWAAAIFRGEQPDFRKYFDEKYTGRPRGRAELVSQLEKAVNEGATLLQQKPTPRAIGLIEHAGEHYGKLATIYRLNNLVPPASRGN